ncbi:phosphonate metabolism transcriptional regulator PhnF [Pseudanabaena sp. PCC 6802]|uniref:phosphonate metabolism transcriptional regulator PhnF n=1 Tax=Pseudanabaena sp. PCC 6802 TaxID=118173 RepID=UPI00034DAAF5|nr:phosphonate metabolism transcriptional regulator PhnF [Pseudanabaena sp. PCC 6802]
MNSEITPLYVQIAAELRHNIQQNVYRVGEQLPTEAQLAERFAVNRHTLRQAISLLKTEGLLRVDRGRGTFVAGPTIRYPIGHRVRYNEALKAQGRQASFLLLRALETPADTAVAKGLEIAPGESVALVERLGFADGEPISITTGYFPLKHFPNLLDPFSLEQLQALQSLSKWLQQNYGCDHIRRSTTVSARSVLPQDARLLQLPLNQPVLLAESVNVDRAGKVIEYGVTRLRGDRVELAFENRI